MTPLEDLEQRLRRRLASDPIVDDTTLAVSARDGTVTLAGEVPDKDTLEHIKRTVRRELSAAGSDEVTLDNLVTIAPRAQARDHDVVRELEQKLEDDFPASDVAVKLVGSTAVLSGSTPHDAVRNEIERMVQAHAYVERTVNHIRVV